MAKQTSKIFKKPTMKNQRILIKAVNKMVKIALTLILEMKILKMSQLETMKVMMISTWKLTWNGGKKTKETKVMYNKIRNKVMKKMLPMVQKVTIKN